MQSELAIAVLAGLGGMIGWGSADFFAKKTIDAVGDIVSLVWAHLFGTITLFLVVLYRFYAIGKGITIPQTASAWGGLIFFGALQALVYLFVYKGFSKGLVSVLNPVFASFSGLVAIISILFLGEMVTVHKITALAVVFVGVLALSLDMGALRLKKLRIGNIPGLKEIGLATVMATFWTLGWDKFVGGQDWVSYAFFMYAFMTVAMYIISRVQKVKLSVITPGLWKFLILIGLGETVAYLAISYGYSNTSLTSVVALLSGAFSLPTIILARLFLKEKVSKAQTWGSIIIITGIIILSL